jgi:hypothetical protein
MASNKTQKPADIVTLADLAPRRTVVGGSERRVFGATAHPDGEKSMTITKKDLPAKKVVKGGKIVYNDNLTLIRAAKPGKKDLPAKKTVKGGIFKRT